MNDRLHTAHRLAADGLIPDISLDELDLTADRGEVTAFARGKIIQDPDTLLFPYQCFDHVRADKAGSASDQVAAHRHTAISPRSVYAIVSAPVASSASRTCGWVKVSNSD